jgi:exosortase H (IPTLxxWG-CTERM-specific)
VLRFGLKFGALMGLFYALALLPFFDRLFYSYLEANASLSNAILRVLGQDSQVADITIRSAQFGITVRRGCDAIEPSWFFCAAVLSFPASFGRRFAGMVVGSLLLQVLNLVRIVSLYYIGLLSPRFFDTAHLEIWPVVFIVTAMVAWLVWIRGTDRVAPPRTHAVV